MEDFSFEGMEDFEEFMNGLNKVMGMMEKINKAAEESVFDSLSTPIAQFELVTGEDPMEGGYMTLCHIAPRRGEEEKEKKVACVSAYDTLEEAMKGHNEWRRMIITNPPALIKDVRRNEIIYV